jgi:hypothetical protein
MPALIVLNDDTSVVTLERRFVLTAVCIEGESDDNKLRTRYLNENTYVEPMTGWCWEKAASTVGLWCPWVRRHCREYEPL